MTVPLSPEQLAEHIERVIRGTLGTHEATVQALDDLYELLSRLQAAERERDEALARSEIDMHQCDDMTASALDSYQRAEAAEARVAELEAALRSEFIRILPDLDYEEIVPGSENEDGSDPVYRWAWEGHPWFALVGLTSEWCADYIAATAPLRARLAAVSDAPPGREPGYFDYGGPAYPPPKEETA